MGKLIAVVTRILHLYAVLLVPPAIAAAQPTPPSFAELAADLAQMSNFFGGGRYASQPVTFDVEAARAAGFPEESILLAADLAGFSDWTIQLKQIESGQAVSRLLGFYCQLATDLVQAHIAAGCTCEQHRRHEAIVALINRQVTEGGEQLSPFPEC
jgi:hypothetical protein